MSGQGALEFHKFCRCGKVVAVGFVFPAGASGEAGPGRPAGTAAGAWDIVLALRL